jgi:uncharacterized protein (DUF58 family)
VITPVALRAEADSLGQSMPALLAEAERLSSALSLGEHGRKRAGHGADFWQYRPAMPGDSARSIDWRRSAKSDAPYIREREWQAAQGVTFWVDPARSMQFQGAKSRPTKAERAAVLAMALAISLLKGGERVAVEGQGRPRAGMAQLQPMAMALTRLQSDEFGAPSLHDTIAHGRAVVISDFLGDLDPLQQALATSADKGVRGAMIQVLDPVEEDFPFDGRTIFQSIGGGIAFETQEAGDLRQRYLERLAERKAELARMARALGWHVTTHHTGSAALPCLLWAHQALGVQR